MTAFENIVGKVEIAHKAQFVLFPTIFSTHSDISTSFVHIFNFKFLFTAELEDPKIAILGKGLTHSHTIKPFDAPGKQAFGKHCGKRKNCSYRAIFPFPTVFSTRLVIGNPLRAISPVLTVFSKGLFPRGVKRCHCVGMG